MKYLIIILLLASCGKVEQKKCMECRTSTVWINAANMTRVDEYCDANAPNDTTIKGDGYITTVTCTEIIK